MGWRVITSSASLPAVARAGLRGGAGGGGASFPSWAAGMCGRTGGSTDVMFHIVLCQIFFLKLGHCIVEGVKGNGFWWQLSSPEAFHLLANIPTAMTFACYHYPVSTPKPHTHGQVSAGAATSPHWQCPGRLEGNRSFTQWIKNPKTVPLHQLKVLL